MPRVTKPIRVEQSYHDRVQKLADEGNRPIGYQLEAIIDYYEAMQKLSQPKDKQQETAQ